MNLAPAVLIFVFWRRLDFSPDQFLVWRNFSFAAVGLFILLLVLPSSTALDRVSLRHPAADCGPVSHTWTLIVGSCGRVAISAYSTIVLLVWLNFAAHAEYWFPYRLYPL